MTSKPSGLSEEATEAFVHEKPSDGTLIRAPLFDFVQAERDRLRRSEFDTSAVSDSSDSRVAGAAESPFPPMDDVTTLRLSRFKELWHTRHQSILATIPRGTGLLVDLGTGLYVTGGTRLQASDRFREIFGPERTALSEEVGIPVTLGSGWWALQSEK